MLKEEKNFQWTDGHLRVGASWPIGSERGIVVRQLTAYRPNGVWKWFINLTAAMLEDFEQRKDTDFVFLGDVLKLGSEQLFVRVFGHKSMIYVSEKPIDELIARGLMRERASREARRFERLRKLGENDF